MSSEKAARGWSRDQTGRATAVAVVVGADSHSLFVEAVDNRILIVALDNQYIVPACGFVGSLRRGYPPGRRAAGRTRRVDNRQAGTAPEPVAGTVAAAAAAIVAAGRIVECTRWDLCLRNWRVAVAAAVASQRSIAGTRDLEEGIQHLCLESEKRRWRCDL